MAGYSASTCATRRSSGPCSVPPPPAARHIQILQHERDAGSGGVLSRALQVLQRRLRAQLLLGALVQSGVGDHVVDAKSFPEIDAHGNEVMRMAKTVAAPVHPAQQDNPSGD